MRNSAAAMPWRCPRCRGVLIANDVALVCASCPHSYPMFGDIPDLRVSLPSWIDVETDRRNAQRLRNLSATVSTAELVAEVLHQRYGPETDVRERTAQTLEGPARLERELDDWLAVPTSGSSSFLDLGCGAGALLAAAAARGRDGVGMDVSLAWLVVAHRLVSERGGTPRLVAAMAEALPLPDGSIESVVSLDVIEHVGDQRQYLREINRILVPGGACALATPNRYSLTAEPHVKVWGVGWLPRAWQARYVNWCSGNTYTYCRLLGVVELMRMVHACTNLEPHILLGAISGEELRRFRPLKAVFARAYNWALRFRLARTALLAVCPFFRIIARKRLE